MPRKINYSRNEVLTRAMHHFWRHGFTSTSMADLVRVSQVSRAALYANFKNKDTLFLACLDKYREQVVTPAFNDVEKEGANLESISNYFVFQIKAAEAITLPGPGCLFANSMTEIGPHNKSVQTYINAHNQRLSAGFLNALSNITNSTIKNHSDLKALAEFLATSAQGLWSYSRSVSTAKPLYAYTNTLIQLIEFRATR